MNTKKNKTKWSNKQQTQRKYYEIENIADVFGRVESLKWKGYEVSE